MNIKRVVFEGSTVHPRFVLEAWMSVFRKRNEWVVENQKVY